MRADGTASDRPAPAAPDRRADLSLPAALPLLLEPDRHRRRPIPATSCATEDWQRVFREAADLGVLQLALTGGEPMARKEIVELAAHRDRAGLYSTLVTSALPFPKRARGGAARGRARPRPDQLPGRRPGAADAIAGTTPSTARSRRRALAQELGFPLTINVRAPPRATSTRSARSSTWPGSSAPAGSSSPTRSTTAGRSKNRDALMPTRAQLERGRGGRRATAMRARGEDADHLRAARLLRGPAQGRAWAAGAAYAIVVSRRTATPCPATARGAIPGLELRQRARALAALDLARVGGVQGLPRRRVDAGALPAAADRPPGRGLRRLPLPGAGAHRRRGQRRPGLPASPRSAT